MHSTKSLITVNVLKMAEAEEKYMLRLLSGYQKVLYDIHQAKQRYDCLVDAIREAKAEAKAQQQPAVVVKAEKQ